MSTCRSQHASGGADEETVPCYQQGGSTSSAPHGVLSRNGETASRRSPLDFVQECSALVNVTQHTGANNNSEEWSLLSSPAQSYVEPRSPQSPLLPRDSCGFVVRPPLVSAARHAPTSHVSKQTVSTAQQHRKMDKRSSRNQVIASEQLSSSSPEVGPEQSLRVDVATQCDPQCVQDFQALQRDVEFMSLFHLQRHRR